MITFYGELTVQLSVVRDATGKLVVMNAVNP